MIRCPRTANGLASDRSMSTRAQRALMGHAWGGHSFILYRGICRPVRFTTLASAQSAVV